MDFRAKGINNKSYQTWSDTIQKETEARLRWNLNRERMKEKFPNNTDTSFKEMYETIQFEDFLNKRRFRVPEIKLIPKKNSFEKDVNEYLIKLGAKETSSSSLKPIEMYEQDPREKELIYDGISRDCKGRYRYLGERKKYKPEEKFAFPITSSMDYGWNFYDKHDRLTSSRFKSTSFQSPSQFGLKNVIKDTFFRENGVLSDQWKFENIKARGF
ncbi:unnamed protein product [Brachionus calyciflorus]|uniref:Sperm microtubule inner protein 1 C-terminal domain-containing protein n=1 Tax=Brachionus calyciflorus TaxID=104777 RepID=A0A813YUF4_9BILA|nr:unnamed protein product [Brachionus calyciflorus]